MTNVVPTGIQNIQNCNVDKLSDMLLQCFLSPAIGKSNAVLTNLNNMGYKRDSLKTKPKSITQKLIHVEKNYLVYAAYFFYKHTPTQCHTPTRQLWLNLCHN
jgi:hypothetical protein